METTTLSTRFQVVLPRATRQRLQIKPGTRFTVIDKGGVIFLVPEHPFRAYRGMARRASPRGLREKKDRR